jgi:DNA polymerase elongation subunit (family B)
MVKVLIWDIETSPNIGDCWQLYNNTVSLSQLRQSSRVICFGAKWHHEKEPIFYSEYHDGKERMVHAAYELLSEADIVVDYNGRRFDRKHMNREIAQAGLWPAAPYQDVDLYRVVKENFAFPSYKLEYVVEALGVGKKAKTGGHELWVECLLGNAKAWEKMKRYCLQDVKVEEKLYDKILPWIKSHPNIQLYDDLSGCPRCGSAALRKEGFRYTALSKYQRYQCKKCGSWSSSGKRVDGVDLR